MDKPLTSFKRLEGQRWVTIIIDCSEAMKDSDMPPNRLIRMLVLLPNFIHAFFDKNPLSQLQIIETSDGLASIVSPMSGNSDGHIKALRELVLSNRSSTRNDGSGPNLYQGAMSIQNSLICAFKSHRTLPKYGRREILMILGAIASQDPSHPASCLTIAKSTRTSISVIHLAAEMFICKRLANETGGIVVVPLSEPHLIQSLDSYALEGISALTDSDKSSQTVSQARLLTMGFPEMSPILDNFCDISTIELPNEIETSFTCPKCLHRLTADAALPTNCPICRLMLVKSHQLARSYSHLFPQPSLSSFSLDIATQCYGCASYIPPTSETVPLVQAQPILSFHSNPFVGPSSASPAPSSPLNYPIASQCYQCQDCQSIYCGLCKEGTLVHLHQCVGCMEKQTGNITHNPL
jgi:transcription initiation factor TFIIH subunit 2